MKIISSISSIRKEITVLKRKGKRIGFVPTMGALHEGHLSLFRRARKENDVVVGSIFVNPKQFVKGEDFARYPRPKKSDEILARGEKVDIIFSPTGKNIYPSGFLTSVEVVDLDRGLCGPIRPGHFKGVTTIVAKLLNIVQPDVMYLGQKDAQQAVIISRMVQDLNIPTIVRICPTVREKDGLAMSSRNVYLLPEERAKASGLYQALNVGRGMIIKGERNAQTIVRQVVSLIRQNVSSQVDYVECVDCETLQPLKVISKGCLIAAAVRLGQTRLIDNVTVVPKI